MPTHVRSKAPLRAAVVGATLGVTLVTATRIEAQETSALRARIEQRIAAVPGAVVGVSLHDLQSGARLQVNGDTVFHAASTMKVPVMIRLMRLVDAGSLSLAKEIAVANEFRSIVDSSTYSLDAGDDSDSLMYTRLGQTATVRYLIERMITRSSNLATNLLIDLANAPATTALAVELGATHTRVLRGVEDGKAFRAGLNNVTTPNDLTAIMEAIETGRAASASSTMLMREILLRDEFNSEIPAGLPAGTPVAHKTGSITAILHDAAIVYPKNRKPYVLTVMTRGIPDEMVARALIADISREIWDYTVAIKVRK